MLCLLWSVLPFYAAQVDTLMVKSPSMNKEVQVVVVVPDIALGKKGVDCPVIYLLHGFGGNAKTWIGIRPEPLPGLVWAGMEHFGMPSGIKMCSVQQVVPVVESISVRFRRIG